MERRRRRSLMALVGFISTFVVLVKCSNSELDWGSKGSGDSRGGGDGDSDGGGGDRGLNGGANSHQQVFSHHRQKRLFWITNDGRIALPPGTVMTITPTLALPFVRYPPYGFLSNMSISLPFTIDFDKLGLTDNENPYGALPSAFDTAARQRRSSAAEFIATFVKRGINNIDKRDAMSDLAKNTFHGGERALLYGTAEDMLANFGFNGKACLLRAICEVQGHPLNNFGLIGEMLKLFFTASKSPFADLLEDYVEAENRGKFHGECWPYFKDCPKSLFRPSENKYAENTSHESAAATGKPDRLRSINRASRETEFSPHFIGDRKMESACRKVTSLPQPKEHRNQIIIRVTLYWSASWPTSHRHITSRKIYSSISFYFVTVS